MPRASIAPPPFHHLAIASALVLAGCAITPQPITPEERGAKIAEDRAVMYRGQAPVAGPLTMEEAMARALRYNLDNRVKLMEQALAMGQLDMARYDMLPRLVGVAGYATRSSELVLDSQDVSTRRIALGNTTSQDRTHTTFDLSLAWNVLDFGVSYFQAHQQADRALIAQERRRKTMHALMQQVRQAYWLAVGAQALEALVEPQLKLVNQALADAAKITKERLRPPLETLNYRKALLDIVRQLESLRDELNQAKPRLAALMNIEPGATYTLSMPKALVVPSLRLNLEQMEERALRQRPELVEADLQERISVNETKKALSRMLPGIEVSMGPHYDSNQFLRNQNWVDYGLRVSWNLFNLVTGPKQLEVAETQLEVARMQRLALNMAVLTQVHVSYNDMIGRLRQYELASELHEIDEAIFQQTRIGAANDSQSRLNEIRSSVGALMADFRRYQNYASMQAAFGQVIASIGDDPVPEKFAALATPEILYGSVQEKSENQIHIERSTENTGGDPALTQNSSALVVKANSEIPGEKQPDAAGGALLRLAQAIANHLLGESGVQSRNPNGRPDPETPRGAPIALQVAWRIEIPEAGADFNGSDAQ